MTMSPRRASDLRISAPLSNPGLRSENTHGPQEYTPLSPIVNSDLSQRQTHASYPPMHNALPFDGTQPAPYLARFSSPNPQSPLETRTMPQRKSTLKSIMRKLFGRKRKSDPVEKSGFGGTGRVTAVSVGSSGFRSSDNPFITGIPEPTQKPSTKSPSSQVLPSPEITPTEATYISPSSALEGAEEPTENSNGDSRSGRPRRATLPSIVLSTDESRELASKIAQEGSGAGSVSPNGQRIGFGSANQFKRRSQSEYALREMARAHRMSPIQWRRRSDEMKLWRASFGKKPEVGFGGQDERPESRSTITEEKDPNEIRVASLDQNGELSQFDFGNLMSNIQDDSAVSLTQRVSTLEVKLMDLELAIAKIRQSKSSLHSSAPSAPPESKREEIQHIDTEPTISALPIDTRAVPSNPAVDVSRNSPTDLDRPISTATLRPQAASQPSPPSSPPSSTSPNISVDQYSALTTLVRREQAARKILERQVQQLQQQLLQTRGSFGMAPDAYARPSSPSSSTTSSQLIAKHGRMDSGMWKQPNEAGGNASLDNYSMRTESSIHRMHALDRIMGRT